MLVIIYLSFSFIDSQTQSVHNVANLYYKWNSLPETSLLLWKCCEHEICKSEHVEICFSFFLMVMFKVMKIETDTTISGSEFYNPSSILPGLFLHPIIFSDMAKFFFIKLFLTVI